MQIIIHSGLPKTGTTAIQNWLADHPEELALEKILYPSAFPSPAERFHRFLAIELRTKNSLQRAKQIITEARRASVEILLFSIEGITAHIDQLRFDMAKVFEEIVGSDKLTFVVCIRPYEQWVSSLYKQCVITSPLRGNICKSALESQYGCALSFSEFKGRPDIMKIADRESIQGSLKRLFPAATVSFFDYSSQLVEVFLSYVNLKVSGQLAVKERCNTAIPDPYIELLRWVNSWSKSAMTDKLVRFAVSKSLKHDHVHLGLYEISHRFYFVLRPWMLLLSIRIFFGSFMGNKKLLLADKQGFDSYAYRKTALKVSATLVLRALFPFRRKSGSPPSQR